MAKKLNKAQLKTQLIAIITKKGGKATASDIVKGLKVDKQVANEIAKELVKEGRIKPDSEGFLVLVAEKKPAAKKAAPAKKAAKKAAPAPEPEEDDEFEFDEDEAETEEAEDEELDLDEDEEEAEEESEEDEEEAEEEEEEDEEESEEDEDEGLDEDDEGLDDDEEEEEVAPAPKGKAKGKAKASTPAHKQFTMAFKPIDTLDDDELTERIDMALAAAESLAGQGHELVAEMLMRSIAKARRQLNKRK